MSELSVKVAREHEPLPVYGSYEMGNCTCGWLNEARDAQEGFLSHLADVTEAAVRETIAADIEAMPLGTAIHRVSGRTMAHAVRTEAARIARGES